MSIVLTNNANTSIILTLNNVNSPEANVISMAPGESILYDSVIISNIFDINYNVPLIQEYIDAGILLKQDISSVVESKLQILPSGNTVINISTGIPKLISNIFVPDVDNLQVLPATNINGEIQYIYYKSIQGMSISSDFGKSQVLINNSNLLYPDEITSFAVQIYDSVDGILKQVNRLYIGTLKEGVKTFTPGIDTTYVDFDTEAAFNDVSPIFKNSLTQTTTTNITTNVIGPVIDTTIEIQKSFPSFCPTYVLAIINDPFTTGCPIFIASRTIQTEIDTTIDIDINGVPSYPSPVETKSWQVKVCFKYLQSKIYIDNIKTDTPSGWFLIQQGVGQTSGAITQDTLPDISTVITLTGNFSLHVLDVMTEYTPFGAILLTKSNNTNNLHFITCTDNISTIPSISSIILPSDLLNEKLKNISYLAEIESPVYYNIFITTNTEVWRYSSRNSAWEKFLYETNPISYFTTSVVDGILNPAGGGTKLKELSNFIMVPKKDTTNEYVGILGSELGLISYNLKLVNNSFTAGAKITRTLLFNIAKSVMSDIKYSIYGQNINIFTCSYTSQIPRTYINNIHYLHLVENDFNLMDDVYYIKPDVELVTDSMYYVSTSSFQVVHIPSGEQKSSDDVLINANYTYNLLSPKYTFKLNSLSDDTILVNSLTSTLASKYYFPTITERIISSLSPAELDVLQLNEFSHTIPQNYITTINISTPIGSPTTILNNSLVILPDTYTYNGINYTAFVCINLNNKTVLPSDITTKQIAPSKYTSYLTFNSPFSGTIYTSTETSVNTYSVEGLFSVIEHNLDRYPQVILDNSVIDLLNDIHYIDGKRLEISFRSAVNTSISLV